MYCQLNSEPIVELAGEINEEKRVNLVKDVKIAKP